MTRQEAKKILKLHKKWLKDGTKGKRANLGGTNLRGADLIYADLRYASLIYTNLIGADLRYANLMDANLIYANLRGASLMDANLKGADLRYCIGNGKEVKSLQIGTYSISYTKYVLNIGCESHTVEEWKNFSDEEINNMDTEALSWWKLNKHIIIELAEREAVL